MTREDIIRMARDSGFLILKFDGEDEVMEGDGNCFQTDEIESFAELVAAYERKECAKIADNNRYNTEMLTSLPLQSGAAQCIADAIRARGEK